MSYSRVYNLSETDADQLEKTAKQWKTPMLYKFQLDDNNWQGFTNPPTHKDMVLAKSRAYHNTRKLNVVNRLKDKIADRKKALTNSDQPSLEN